MNTLTANEANRLNRSIERLAKYTARRMASTMESLSYIQNWDACPERDHLLSKLETKLAKLTAILDAISTTKGDSYLSNYDRIIDCQDYSKLKPLKQGEYECAFKLLKLICGGIN